MKSKFCHLCHKSFVENVGLLSHMQSMHEKEGHEMANCEDCAAELNQRNIRDRTSNKRVMAVTAADLMSEKADQSLNDILVDVHMSMHLLPFV